MILNFIDFVLPKEKPLINDILEKILSNKEVKCLNENLMLNRFFKLDNMTIYTTDRVDNILIKSNGDVLFFSDNLKDISDILNAVIAVSQRKATKNRF